MGDISTAVCKVSSPVLTGERRRATPTQAEASVGRARVSRIYIMGADFYSLQKLGLLISKSRNGLPVLPISP